MTRRRTRPTRPPVRPKPRPTPAANLRERVLADCAALKVPSPSRATRRAAGRRYPGGPVASRVRASAPAEQADQRRERSIAHRIREARFRDPHTLATFDWQFNARPSTARRSKSWPPGRLSAARTIWSWWAKAAWASF